VRYRRWALVALVVGVMIAGIGPSYALDYFAGHFQRSPRVDWTVPGETPLDGIGQWLYVAPIPPAGPEQQPLTAYVYGMGFETTLGRGVLGLSRDGQGPIAGIQPTHNSPAVTIRYDWLPGRFYFLLVYHAAGDGWTGWIFDDAASAWTIVGTAQGPVGAGLLKPASVTEVRGSQGTPQPAFSPLGPGPARGTCRAFPQVDVYVSAPVGYRGAAMTPGVHAATGFGLGDCPTQFSLEEGWGHLRIGWPPQA
jgi:hypothetical protein